MTTERTTTLAASDGTSLVARDLGAADASRTLVIVHGYGEHGGRYLARARTFVDAGYRVVIPDVRGHGRSGGPRGHVDRFDRYLDDLAIVVDAAAPKRLSLLGHSHGGLIVAAALTAGRTYGADRVGLSSPFLGLGLNPPAWKVKAAALLSKLGPRVSLPSEIKPSDVSRDPAVVAAYSTDPLNHHVNNARWYTEAMAAIDRCFERAAAVTVPTLVMQAGADKLVSPAAARRWADAAPATLVRYEEVAGAYHELLFEPDGQRHADRLLRWFEHEEAG